MVGILSQITVRVFPMRRTRRRGDRGGGQLLPVQLHGAEEADQSREVKSLMRLFTSTSARRRSTSRSITRGKRFAEFLYRFPCTDSVCLGGAPGDIRIFATKLTSYIERVMCLIGEYRITCIKLSINEL